MLNINFCMSCGQALEDREMGGEMRRACPACSFVHWGNYSVGVGALVMKDQKLLLVRRMHDPGKGKWTNPGGFIEQHETIESTIVREVLEETGITVKVNRIIGLGDKPGDVHHTYITFVMEYVSGEPIADGVEVDEAGFYSLEEMKELNVADFTWRQARLVMNDNHNGFQLDEKINAPANGYRLWQ